MKVQYTNQKDKATDYGAPNERQANTQTHTRKRTLVGLFRVMPDLFSVQHTKLCRPIRYGHIDTGMTKNRVTADYACGSPFDPGVHLDMYYQHCQQFVSPELGVIC